MLKKIIIIFFSLSLFSQAIVAKEQAYIREYTYQASETDSKVSARNAALLFLKQNLLNEIGTYVGSSLNIVSVANGAVGETVSVGQVKSLSEGYIKTEILEQRWNGVTFFVKAKMIADPDEISEKLKSIVESSNQSNTKSKQEFEYWKSVVQIDTKAAYLDYMSKYVNGKYHDLAKIAIVRLSKQRDLQGIKPDWIIKQPGNISLIVRHDTGWFDDLDPDIITREMGQTVKEMYKRFSPPDTKFNLITHFDKSKVYQFNYKNQSQSECKRSESDLVAGAMLNDYDGADGMYRPIKLFIYNCETSSFKISSFVPKINSPKKFWRENALKKNLRVFIREYLDTI